MSLRIKELTEVLERLGMRKTGRKGDLQSRLLAVFGDSSGGGGGGGSTATQQARMALAKRYIEEAYCAMIGAPYAPASDAAPGGGAGAAAAAGASQQTPKRRRVGGGAGGGGGGAAGDELLGLSELIDAAGGGATGGGAAGGTQIRCLCGWPGERGAMVQCEAPQCHVWQHAACVAAAAPPPPAAPRGRAPPPRPPHFCERCRVARADPFWEVFDASIFEAARVNPTGRTVQMGAQAVPVSAAWAGRRAGGEGWGAAF